MILPSIINFLLFQTVWFLSLLLEHGSLAYSAIVIVLMFYLSAQKKQDAILLLTALPLALLAEFLAVNLGLLEFKTSPFPPWLALLWIALILCINTSMSFLKSLKLWQAFLVCLVFAPASYWAGARFEVLTIEVPLWHFWLAYGALWSVFFTAILFINTKINAYIDK